MKILDIYFEEVFTKVDFLKKWNNEGIEGVHCGMVYHESMATGKPITQKKWAKVFQSPHCLRNFLKILWNIFLHPS